MFVNHNQTLISYDIIYIDDTLDPGHTNLEIAVLLGISKIKFCMKYFIFTLEMCHKETYVL